MTVRDCVGGCFWVLFHKLCNKLCCAMHKAEMAIGFRVHKAEPILGIWM